MTNDKRAESEALNPTVLRWRWHTLAVFSDLDAEPGGLPGDLSSGSPAAAQQNLSLPFLLKSGTQGPKQAS